MLDYFRLLFDTSDFTARWDCGKWTALHGWTHIVSDLAIWGAYTAIPILLAIVALRRRDWGFPRILWLFVAFILACGTTHLVEAIIFWQPIYRVAAVAKIGTALVSWTTVIFLIYQGPHILRLPSITEINLRLEREVGLRRAVERQLVEHAEVLQLALEAGGIGTWRLDLHSNRATRNAGFNQIFGHAPTPSTQPVEEVFARIHEEDRDAIKDAIQKARRGESDYNVEYRILHPDRTTRWVRDRAKLIRNANGEPELLTGAIVDITDIRSAEERRALLSAIVDSTPDAVISQSPDGAILSWNAGAEQTFGFSAAEALGNSINLIIPEEHVDEATQFRAAASRGERMAHLETVRRCKDGRLIDIWMSISPIFNHLGRVTAISVIERDITERNRYDARLRQLNRILQAKNDELEQFVYIVSHDLKSPLVTMLGFVGLLREDLGSNVSNEVKDGLKRIENAANRMSGLIDDVLELSRIGQVQPKSEPVDIAAIVEQLRIDLAQEIAQAGARIVLEGRNSSVRADSRTLHHVLQNLLTNALKYGCTGDNAEVRVGTTQRPGETLVYVRDNGPGIAPEHHQRIFRMFEQVETGQAGTGVGLALVARIMRAHGGRVWVESAPGQGATFWLEFPDRPLSDESDDNRIN